MAVSGDGHHARPYYDEENKDEGLGSGAPLLAPDDSHLEDDRNREGECWTRGGIKLLYKVGQGWPPVVYGKHSKTLDDDPKLETRAKFYYHLFRRTRTGYPGFSLVVFMLSFGACALYALNALVLISSNTPVTASPVPAPQAEGGTPASSYWLSQIARTGKPAFGNDTDYKLFRNVKELGVKGDGITDDTLAINQIIMDAGNGNRRCGFDERDASFCDSRTTQPAIIYFPPGEYLVSKPIIQYYYTQIVGDALSLPVIKAAPKFEGMAVIDADPYIYPKPDGTWAELNGKNWWTNQNNFFRQIRNIVVDTRDVETGAAGIHWQVAQATSLQNIVFEMRKGGAEKQQKGIFMDNGSGGFMSDLVFNNGDIGAFLGSQQFTSRNLTFNDCETAIVMNWNWLWALKSITVNNAKVGINMTNAALLPDGGVTNLTAGALLVLDSKFTNVEVGVDTRFSAKSTPSGAGSVILNNVDFVNTPIAVQGLESTPSLAGNKLVKSWMQGHRYVDNQAGQRVAGDEIEPHKPEVLLDANSKIFERGKPQYEAVPVTNFVSVMAKGAKGDGKTDDTDAIQNAINGLQDGQILYIDHGGYLIHKTIIVPSGKNIKITGEHWPLLLATGEFFANEEELKPVIQVGDKSGDAGSLEMSDVILGTAGPAPGAILMQWNLNSEQGQSGLWDTHFRVGGYAGTELQLNCLKNNLTQWTQETVRKECQGAGMLFHSTKDAGNFYLENTWFWVSDHELDQAPWSQIDIMNARGVLIESQGPSWWYGTASEHSVLYQYQLNGAKNVFMSAIQTETPYYQGNPNALVPFKIQSNIKDPDYANCKTESCKKSWGLRIVDSSDYLLFGGGLYSFFENYGQDCVPLGTCQENMISIEGTSSNIHIFGLSTVSTENMVTINGQGAVFGKDNISGFCSTIGRFSTNTQ